MSDSDLLKSYAQGGAADAFATLVNRHVDLVYSVARRHVRSASIAEEVAQSVFVELARHARKIKPGTPLIAWLHIVSRRTAINVMRDAARRQAREKIAAEIAAMKSPSSEWSGVEPLLDEAVESLPEPDRAAILLRFFENKSLREVGLALGTSDDAAQKRVTRAIEQLRAFFLRRGVTITATGLATDLSAHALQTAPIGLGASISTAVGFPIAAGVVAEAVRTVAMTTLQKSMLAAAIIFSVGGALLESNTLHAQRAEAAALHQSIDDIAAEIRRTTAQRDLARRGFLEAQQRFAARPPPETAADAALETEMSAWLERTELLKRIRDQRPDLVTPEVGMLPDDALFAAARELHIDTEEQVRSKFAQLRSFSESTMVPKIRQALWKYLDAHEDMLPENSRELALLFDPPIDPAVLDRYVMTARGKVTDRHSTAVVVAEHSPLDFSRDLVWDINLNGHGGRRALDDYVRKAMLKFIEANNGMKPTQPEHLQPYLPAPVDPAKLQPFLNAPRR